MKGETVTLNEMLFCREYRAQIQELYLKKYQCTVISFCMNIPGPVKTNPLIRNAFSLGNKELLHALKKEEIPVLDSLCIHEKTGDELILSARGDAVRIKELASTIEDRHPLGRLFDIDVIAPEGTKLSRGNFRRCLICGRQAQDCARTRRHTVPELQSKVEELLLSALENQPYFTMHSFL